MRRLGVPVLAASLIGLLVYATGSSAGGSATCNGFSATIQGSQGDNSLVGTTGPDVIAALGGDDTVSGLSGDDQICGGAGDDVLLGGGGSDGVSGGDGNDYVEGGLGPDALSGGAGFDNLGYQDAAGPVGVSLAGGTGSGGDGQDDLSGFEAVTGSAHNDVLNGDPAFNSLSGGAGNDELNGRAGVDVLVGGTGSDALLGGEGSADLAYFFDLPAGVDADLEDGIATSGAHEDILIGVEGVIGSGFPDTLRGDAGENIMGGGQGDDLLDGRGATDFLLSFGRLPEDPEAPDALEVLFGGPHTIDLAAETAFDESDPTEVAGDTIINFEAAAGGHRDDVIRGTDGDDVLAGEKGDDQLFGLGGDDGIDGAGGDDLIDGGTGSGDQVVFFFIPGVEADLAKGRAVAGGDTDRLRQIEEMVGSEKADVLIGDSKPNLIAGVGGADRIVGGGGKDILFGRPIELPLGDLEGAPGLDPPGSNLKPAKLLDGGRGRDVCQGGRSLVSCEIKRLTPAAKNEVSSVIKAIQDIKRRKGVRLS